MKSIPSVVSILLGLSALSVFADDVRDQQMKELEAIKAELKPLRAKAYLEPDVIAARHKLDEAYKAYWESVRVAMVRLDSSKKELIEKDVMSRKELSSIGSHASDYEKKAAVTAAKKSP